MNKLATRALVALTGSAIAMTGLAVVSANAAEKTGECRVTTTGTADWALKTSFNSYLEGPIANGTAYKYKSGIEVRDGVETSGERTTRQFTWPVEGSEEGTVNLGGGVHWTGHNHYDGDDESQVAGNFLLDLDFSNPTVKFDGNKGTLLVDFKSREFVDFTNAGEFLTGTQTELATITFDEPIDLTQENVTVTGQTTLSEIGVDVMGNFYDAGDELAPITLNLTNEVVCDEPEAPVEPEVPVDPEKPVDPETPVDPEKPGDDTDDNKNDDANNSSSNGDILGILGILAVLGGVGALVYNFLVASGFLAAFK
ncbi:hypothetical protein YH66_02230 [[Brevibacterium] flavum]|uniref:Htaa domain-containing protein n=1 Tax=[Brevibacterium] flavum TaxID=92706 RepID=A0A0F6Z494_9CORY|nr:MULTISPECIES: HtaA domain-containing protein [Corynebacterium]AKF26453.1 hypothetical protein YH66_02230 [[Brevibacterium] flavum]AST19684.1 hypothetical protein CEY17_02245 [Corynebacterium glutamicum ATCC 14067]KEI22141.1 hypothetical protein KIQ_006020 [Corynebacterium glutamicum ATCC 14067]KIH74725.1 hypothetical protein SD36_02305 [Corynebacterium glutamicum]OKX93171.1 hypothetical protein AUP71_10790 [Corynebacterium glutamicum]